jgi:phage terminase large subunit
MFNVMESEIRGPRDSLIIFKGMQSYNSENIKSLEGYDIAWVEEAQTLSEHSLSMLRPTIRKDGSELWFSWNPRYKTDAVDAFFRRSPPSDAISVQINWRDNPWFPAVLRKDMEHDRAADLDKYDNVWEGAYGSSDGAILSRWVNAAEREGRISNDVVFDYGGPGIEISSDIGFRDTASWWFWQRRANGFALLNYEGESGWDADDWIDRIKTILTATQWPLRCVHLPHDAKVKTFQSKHSTVERFLAAFGFGKVDIVAQSKKLDQIEAARTIIKRCEFQKDSCEKGIDGLRAWEFDFNPDTQAFSRDPLHNWASHPGDAFSYGCQVMEEHAPPVEVPADVRSIIVGGHSTVTMNDLWTMNKPKGGRI